MTDLNEKKLSDLTVADLQEMQRMRREKVNKTMGKILLYGFSLAFIVILIFLYTTR